MPTKTNNDNTANDSSLIKNLENIKAEFVTLREYVGDNEDELLEKISGIKCCSPAANEKLPLLDEIAIIYS